jgi:hypothetical protein
MENGTKPPQQPKDVPPMMREMMQRMCCAGEFSPADMCRRMMRSMGRTSDAEAQPARQSATTSDGRGSCGRPS